MDIPLKEICHALTHYHIDHAGLAQESLAGVSLLVLMQVSISMKQFTASDHYIDILLI
jgi:glyoxylase-like metal-dependent hydrolase (beta-lactamase superfamily II)